MPPQKRQIEDSAVKARIKLKNKEMSAGVKLSLPVGRYLGSSTTKQHRSEIQAMYDSGIAFPKFY